MKLKFYLWIIIIGVTLIISLNAILTSLSWWDSFSYTLTTGFLIISADILIAWLCHRRVHKCNPFGKFYRVTERERKFWIAIGVKKYKDLCPDIGVLVKFPKDKIQDPNSPEYLEHYLRESAVGEVGHWINCFAGLLTLLVFPLQIGLWVCLVNIALNTMSGSALRYNRYMLFKLHKRAIAKRQSETPAVIPTGS